MTIYKVAKVKEIGAGTSEKTGKPWTRQKLRLVHDGETTDVQMFCGQFVSVPSEGDDLDGTIEPPSAEGRLPEFKPARKGGGGFGGPRVEDPKKQAAIRRMHSQKIAVELIRLGLETATITKPEAFGDLLTTYYIQVDELDKDVQKAGEQA